MDQQGQGKTFAFTHTHGICLDHKPEWKIISDKRLEPDPDQRDRVVYTCCSVKIFFEVETRQCEKCGREQVVRLRRLSICTICGKIRDIYAEQKKHARWQARQPLLLLD